MRHTLSLSDGVGVTLDAVMVGRVCGGYLFVRDPWPEGELLPVYAPIEASSSQLPSLSLPEGLRMLSVEVTGGTMTVGGKRIVAASRLRLYVDSRGRPMHPLPKSPLVPFSWPYLIDLPLETYDSSAIPSTPALAYSPPEQPVFDVGANTVADAKINGGTVALEGVQVIRVYDANGVSPSFLYVQDRNTGSGSPRQIPCGIKVIPSDGVIDSFKPGDIVDVGGTVAGSDSTDPECRIEDAVVEYVSWAAVPPPVGMAEKSTAGGEFGLQQALYLRTPGDTPEIGYGLNPVGTLAWVWGRILWIELKDDHVVYWVDDGSGLERTVIEDGQPVVRKGLKVIAWADSATPARQEEKYEPGQGWIRKDYIAFAGVVGAEFSEEQSPVPVPVVRVGRMNARKIIYVDGSGGDDAYDGLSWAAAKATVQGGIDIASTDDEVWVADGTYYKREEPEEPNVALFDKGQNWDRSGVALYGGFHGNPNGETGRWQRDPGTYETILDGEAENAVIKAVGLTATSRVDSLTIQRGQGGDEAGGGGFEWDNSEGVITNNLIRRNGAFIHFGAGVDLLSSPCIVMHNVITENPEEVIGGGGGIACHSQPWLYIAENEITNNRAGDGAGIAVYSATAVIRDNIITGNTALYDGGGIYLEGAGGVVIRNGITENGLRTEDIPDGTLNGGGIACVGGSPRIEENVIEGNEARFQGGGLFLNGSGAEVVSNAFTDNAAGEGGGAISCDSSALITCNTFDSNTAADYGGAIAVWQSSPEITRNTFTANDGGDRGGAISIYNSTLDIINNLFVGNQVIGAGGGAIYAEALWPGSTYASIVNNTFVENWATSEDPEYGKGGVVRADCNDERVTTDLTFVNNIFYNNAARDASSGNSIWLNPLSAGTLLFSGAFSGVSGLESYHYVRITPSTGCITEQILPQDPAMFGAGYYLAVPGPSYTPLDRGHDHDTSPYEKVPLDDLNGVSRPQGDCTDMGACETEQ